MDSDRHGESIEMLNAKESIETGIYITFTNIKEKAECIKLGNRSMCFCSHLYQDHDNYKACTKCLCNEFHYIFMFPEEQGMWWLRLTKDFNRFNWKAKCKCTLL